MSRWLRPGARSCAKPSTPGAGGRWMAERRRTPPRPGRSRRRPSMGGFRRDPDFVTVLALEDFDDDTRTATMAALLTRRVNRPRERATHAGSAAEAIALCRDELGRFDLDRVVELLGVDKV